jgi:hypothetical protein
MPAGERVRQPDPPPQPAAVVKAGTTHCCTRCSRVFGSKKALARHTAAKHTAARVWPCPACSNNFRSNTALAQHTAAKHPASTPSVRAAQALQTTSPAAAAARKQSPSARDGAGATQRHSPPDAARPRYTPPRSPTWEELHPTVPGGSALPLALLPPRREPPQRPAQLKQASAPSASAEGALAGDRGRASAAPLPKPAMTLSEARRSLAQGSR